MVGKAPSRFTVGAFSFACSLLVSRPVIGNCLHSKFLRLNGIDVALDGYMWVEWESAFKADS